MTGQDWIALTVVLLAALYALRGFWRAMKGEGGCGCDGGGNTGAGTCDASRDRTGLKRRPVVTSGEIGLPDRQDESGRSPVE